MRLRSEANRIAREVLHERDFVEVETPTLTRSTPEGARDFLVPARLRPGSWYALPQSPQLFKQLLMVAGMERYYQIARCYRDEDFRADRQPEFTQLDIEMSFVDQDDVIELGEAITAALWSELAGYEIPRPIPRLTYAEAMARYGSDKPDLRFAIELTELTEYFADTEFRVFQAPVRRRGGDARAGPPSPASSSTPGRSGPSSAAPAGWPTSRAAPTASWAARWRRTCPTPSARAWPRPSAPSRATASSSPPATRRTPARCSARPAVEIARRCGLVDESAWSFFWVVDAPMFERVRDDAGRELGWTAVHHPFTSPNAEWMDRFESAPDQALAYAYDIVCNGNEIGGGSIRIHRADVQQRVFALLGMDDGGAAGQVRLPARRVRLRPAAARRHRLRLGPHLHAAGRGRLDPRGHRLPEDRRRVRPAHRRAGPDHRRSSARRPAWTRSRPDARRG